MKNNVALGQRSGSRKRPCGISHGVVRDGQQKNIDLIDPLRAATPGINERLRHCLRMPAMKPYRHSLPNKRKAESGSRATRPNDSDG